MKPDRVELISMAVVSAMGLGIVLRASGIINWPWWLLLAPIWVPIAAGVLFVILFFLTRTVTGLLRLRR